MGVHIHPGTMDGALTPICDSCGVSLCWDIGEEDYDEAAEFWDDWICQDCNNGVRLSLQDWKVKHGKS